MTRPGGRKDPIVAAILSLCFPGAGYAYVGDIPKFLRVFLFETTMFCLSGWHDWLLYVALGVHAFFAVGAAGAARLRNAVARDDPPPPVPPSWAGPTGTVAATDPAWSLDGPPPPPPPPPPSPPAPAPAATRASPAEPITTDQFLGELRDLWTARSQGSIDESAFAERKRAAIERVKIEDMDDGVALLEATSALVGAGVMTSAERNRLRLRVSRP